MMVTANYGALDTSAGVELELAEALKEGPVQPDQLVQLNQNSSTRNWWAALRLHGIGFVVFVIAVFGTEGFEGGAQVHRCHTTCALLCDWLRQVLSLQYFEKDTIQISPSDSAWVNSVATLPWIAQPVYGLISDSYPLCGSRRISYIAVCMLVNAACWFSLASCVDTIHGYWVAGFVMNVTQAWIYTCAEAVVVENSSNLEESNQMQSIINGVQQLLMLIGGLLGGLLVGVTSPFMVFNTMGVFFCIGMATIVIASYYSPLTTRQSVQPIPDAPTYFSKLREAASDQTHQRVAWCIFVISAIPEIDTSLFFLYTNGIGFSEASMTWFNTWQQAVAMLAVFVFGAHLATYSVRAVMTWSVILIELMQVSQLLLLTGIYLQLGIPAWVLVAANSAASTLWIQALPVPLFGLVGAMCPPGLEAVFFACFQAIQQAGQFVALQLSAAMTTHFGITSTQFENIVTLRITVIVLKLLCVGCFGLLPTCVSPKHTSKHPTETSSQRVSGS